VNPEINDIFLASLILLNMACWLELFTTVGGPLKRVLCFVWVMLITNTLLVCLWISILQVINLQSIQPLLDVCLRQLQHFMFTDVAATIRRDLLQVIEHMYVLFSGFLCYGMGVAYLKHKLLTDEERSLAIHNNSVESDISDLYESVRSFLSSFNGGAAFRGYGFEESIERILHRLSVPDLWLHPLYSTDYIEQLPKWKVCATMIVVDGNKALSDTESEFSDIDGLERICSCEQSEKPSYSLKTSDCAVCIRRYRCKEEVSCLPCGHTFHKNCIHTWLYRGDEERYHKCPVCRWPANLSKPCA